MRPVNKRPSASCWVLLILAVTFAQPSRLFGQTVHGKILDSTNSRPVPGARVVLIGEEGDTAASGLSDQNGSFVVGASDWGTFVLSVARLGFNPHVDGPLRLRPGDTLEVSYRLLPLAVRLDPVVVQTANTILYLQREGFYRRQRLGFGHQVEPDWIEFRRNAARDIADLMVGIPGVRISYRGGGQFGRGVSLTGMPSLETACSTPLFFLDGNRVLTDGRIEEVIRPEDVHAIEIFRRPSEVPARYGGAESGCGVILIWTQRGAARNGGACESPAHSGTASVCQRTFHKQERSSPCFRSIVGILC